MEQAERNKIMQEFRTGKARVLVGTNVIARGIDVQSVTLVVNYDIPKSPEVYLHRIGRSGRFGRKGFAINFITERDEKLIEIIKEKFSAKMEPLPDSKMLI